MRIPMWLIVLVFTFPLGLLQTHVLAKDPLLIRGRITNEEGEAIAGARVEYGYFSSEEDERTTVLSQADGSYHMDIFEAGRDYRLGVSAEGYAPKYLDRILPGTREKPPEHSFQLKAVAKVQFLLVHANGKPARVSVRPKAPQIGTFISSFSVPVQPTPLPGHDSAKETDEEGKLVLENLPLLPAIAKDVDWTKTVPISWITLEISGNGRTTSKQVTTKDLATSTMDDGTIRLEISNYLKKQPHEGVLRGRVVDAKTGEAIRKFTVVHRYSNEAKQLLTEDGRFTSRGRYRHGRDYQVRVFAPGYAVCIGRPIAGSEKNVKEYVFKLKEHPSFQGKLVDTDGNPLTGVEVLSGFVGENSYAYIEWASLDRYADGHHSLNNVLRVKTNDRGEFMIPEAPNQLASLIISAPNFGRTVIPPEKRPQARTDGIVVIAVPRAASIFAIADRDTELGAMANSVGLSFKSRDGFDHMYHSERLNKEGTLRYGMLAPGEYTVSLYSATKQASYPIYSTRITLGEGEEVPVELGRIGGDLSLSGKVEPFSMVRIHPRDVNQWPRGFAVRSDIDGAFKLTNLKAGSYAISVDRSSASSGYFSQGRSKQIELTEDTVLPKTKNRLP